MQLIFNTDDILIIGTRVQLSSSVLRNWNEGKLLAKILLLW